MKKTIILALMTMLFNIFLSSCADKSTSDKNGASKSPIKYFPTFEVCQESAKSDLMEALKTMKGNSFGTNLEAVEQSKAVKLVTNKTVDFNTFLGLTNPSTMDSIAQADGNAFVPFYGNNKVAAVATINQDKKGWSVSQLFNKKMSDDLSAVYAVEGNLSAEVVYFEIPNINASVYEVNKQGEKLYYTDFKGFDLKKGVPLSDLLPALKAEAVIFQREYGELVKKQKLTH